MSLMSYTFAIIWVVFWGWIFDVTNGPSGLQVWGFIVIGILPPVIQFYKYTH